MIVITVQNLSKISGFTKRPNIQHDGIKHDCSYCDYKATTKSSLTNHKQSQHDGIEYDCNNCDHKAKSKHNLRIHKRRILCITNMQCTMVLSIIATEYSLAVHKLAK